MVVTVVVTMVVTMVAMLVEVRVTREDRRSFPFTKGVICGHRVVR